MWCRVWHKAQICQDEEVLWHHDTGIYEQEASEQLFQQPKIGLHLHQLGDGEGALCILRLD